MVVFLRQWVSVLPALCSNVHSSYIGLHTGTSSTQSAVSKACVLSTLLYRSEAWTTYVYQEKSLNTFHIRSLKNNGHPLAKQKDQQRGTKHPSNELHSNHPCPPPLAMDRTCHQNGGNPNPETTAVQTTKPRKKESRKTSPETSNKGGHKLGLNCFMYTKKSQTICHMD